MCEMIKKRGKYLVIINFFNENSHLIYFLIKYKEQNSFEGGSRKWEPRKRPARHRILDKSGNMRRRVRKIATRNGLRIVSSQPYSPTQQLGSRSKNIAARPFIVMQAEDKVRASEIIKRHLLG